ncbi:MAG: hypothetical protein AAF267_23290 [Deinococcota bacterium]
MHEAHILVPHLQQQVQNLGNVTVRTVTPDAVELVQGFFYALRNHYRMFGVFPAGTSASVDEAEFTRNSALEFNANVYPLTDSNLAVLTTPRRALGIPKNRAGKPVTARGRHVVKHSPPAGCTVPQCELYCKILDQHERTFTTKTVRRAAPVGLWVLENLVPA